MHPSLHPRRCLGAYFAFVVIPSVFAPWVQAQPRRRAPEVRAPSPDASAPRVFGAVHLTTERSERLEGLIDVQAVQTRLQREQQSLMVCYEPALATAPTLRGDIEVELTVNPDGTATLHRIQGMSGAPDVHDCVRAVLGSLRYPTPEWEPASVRVTAHFTPVGASMRSAPAPRLSRDIMLRQHPSYHRTREMIIRERLSYPTL